ncbi:hypothetical protein AB0910_00055 [Streptomyces sp. NPDC047002]|uniref:hypothetical protein n=1 Tax=Streptomyces sp. NPDC047002 TaxID=3155475 RepID=UPI003454944D
MSEPVDDMPSPALREAARTPEFWRDRIVDRVSADPDVSGAELFRTFEKVYRRRIAREIEERGPADAAGVAAALRSGGIGKLADRA